ncbi:MAG: acyl-CoA thioesterase [Xanthomonadaceae bacterium]|nr:acyl-CoA thioesterase [Xanthomonadaceae bacterium]
MNTANAMPLLMSLTIPVRWRDLDAFNHVNNSTYLTYIEETRLHWMESLPGEWINASYSPLLAAVHVNYRRAANWPATIVVELYCERLVNTSVTLGHRIVDAADREVLYSDGHSVMVWVDPATGKPVPLPEAVRRACAPD